MKKNTNARVDKGLKLVLTDQLLNLCDRAAFQDDLISF